MAKDISQTIRILADIETNIALLYRAFGSAHKGDSAFWQQIAKEEIHHSEMLMSLESYLIDTPALHGLFRTPHETLHNINSKIISILQSCSERHVPRTECFSIAIQLEQSAGEIHFQEKIEGENNNIAVQVLQSLSADDQNHVERIKAQLHGII